jgi:lipoyl(octanoyl) transferase
VSRRRLVVRRLGRIGYAEGVALQQALVRQRQAGEIDDTLLFVEHPPVITLGVKTRGALANVRADAGTLAAQGVEIHESGRGGDVTFHGPGQLVGYPPRPLSWISRRC